MLKSLILVTGPTAIGKTSVAIEVAKHFNTEIVSADSRQIYRELSIGTAAPSIKEQAAVKHHFIHCRSINEDYSASRYEAESVSLIDSLFKRYPVVVMAGGSMLYIEAVCNGIDTMPDVDPALRKNLKDHLRDGGIESLRRQLKHFDPDYYSKVDLKNPARIVHALEICLMTGKPYSSFRLMQKKKRSFQVIKTALNCDRQKLHNRINCRVDEMVKAGLEEEARSLFQFRHLNALNTVGYREFFAFMEGDISKEEAIEQIKRNTRRYARKQLTWFRKDPEMSWFLPEESSRLIEFIENKIN